jgi:hypothetical protein
MTPKGRRKRIKISSKKTPKIYCSLSLSLVFKKNKAAGAVSTVVCLFWFFFLVVDKIKRLVNNADNISDGFKKRGIGFKFRSQAENFIYLTFNGNREFKRVSRDKNIVIKS